MKPNQTLPDADNSGLTIRGRGQRGRNGDGRRLDRAQHTDDELWNHTSETYIISLTKVDLITSVQNKNKEEKMYKRHYGVNWGESEYILHVGNIWDKFLWSGHRGHVGGSPYFWGVYVEVLNVKHHNLLGFHLVQDRCINL